MPLEHPVMRTDFGVSGCAMPLSYEEIAEKAMPERGCLKPEQRGGQVGPSLAMFVRACPEILFLEMLRSKHRA